MNEPNPPKKSKLAESWKSLAGNLFGVQFDGQEDLDDIDIDSVAEAVEQLNPAEVAEPGSAQSSSTEEEASFDEEDLSFDDDSDDNDSEDEGNEVCFVEDSADTEEIVARPEKDSRPTELKNDDDLISGSREESFDRGSFDDEDPFGFGIADLEGDTEIGEEAATAAEDTMIEDDNLDFDASFDFESDDKETAEQEPPKKQPRKRRRSSGESSEEKQSQSAENEPEAASEQVPVKQTADDDDGFWDSLDDWDGSDSRPSSERNKPREENKKGPSRRSPRRSEEPVEAAKEEVSAEVEADSDQDETEKESRTKRPRRRRRRSPRSRKDDNKATETHAEAVQEKSDIAPEDIDQLWGGEDDEPAVVTPASRKSPEPESKRSDDDSSEDRKNRGRGRRRPSRSSENRPDEAVESNSESNSDSEDRSRERSKPRQAYKNIPTWVEAIEMIVRRRDPNPNRGRSRQEGGGRRGGARSSTRKRPPRRRED